MKLLKFALVLLLITGCANTDDVDDSDVTADSSESQSESEESEDAGESSDDGEISENPSPAPAKTTVKNGAYEASGEGANFLYNIASSALKKSEATLAYSVKCAYVIKPLSIKNCMVKTGFLPADAKNKVGKLLLEAKNLPRKKSATNEAVVTAVYSCTKGKTPKDTTCILTKAP